MRRHRAAAAALAASLALGGGPAAAQTSTPAAQPSGSTVTVTVSQTGSDGSGLAAILFKDGNWQAGLGSFVADVTGDPFTMTETIRDAAPFLDERSLEDRPVAVVPPGTHNLVIWVARGLRSYAAWTPQAPIDAVCLVELTISARAARSRCRYRYRLVTGPATSAPCRAAWLEADPPTDPPN